MSREHGKQEEKGSLELRNPPAPGRKGARNFPAGHCVALLAWHSPATGWKREGAKLGEPSPPITGSSDSASGCPKSPFLCCHTAAGRSQCS